MTGAAGGIGSATCRRFLDEGANVVAADLNTESLSFAESERVRRVDVDLRRAEGAAACIDAAVESFGALDLAFLGAGVECRAAMVADFSEAEYERVFDVNVRGMFLCSQAIVKHLQASGRSGGILMVSSIAGLTGNATTSIYNASKHAVVGISRCLAREVGSQGIRVNVLCPGMVDTRMAHSLEQSMGAASGLEATQVRAAVEAGSSLGRYATADEVASMGAWILSDEAPYCHGEIFTIGGGMMA
ncbi:SDR family NAD(P)-dependent oxidoreductase [Parahaliea aestuarii]|uniref:SDR family NAD(P)-dependent oxidoreductase n=1 Tax=Parahaliea aestuarii TaxID=1852021 RepID=UPI001650B038|nr:SDR family oxidoreductase [Parahaliea aestuarii]